MGCWLFSFGFPWDAPFFGRSFRDVEGNNTVRVPNPALSADLLELTDFTLELETLGAKPPPSPQRVPPHKMGSLRSFHPLGRIRTRCLLLAGKTICFALRLPPQHKSHAASTMILQCVLQPKIAKHHVAAMCRYAKHIEAAITVRTTPSPGRTQPAPATHTSCPFTRKSTMFRAAASSPTQVPCNIHAASTMILQCVLQPKIAKHHVAAMCRYAKHIEAAITVRTTPSPGRTQPAPASHTSCPFTRKSTMFRAAASSPTQVPCNIHAASTMILQCVLQPKIPKHHATAMCTKKKNVSRCGFLSNTSPMQHSCSQYNDITMRFATKKSKTQCNCNGQTHAKHIEAAITVQQHFFSGL